MVDHGFDISKIVPYGIADNMPPLLAGWDQMTAVETEETMRIAPVQIHVESAIGRIKTSLLSVLYCTASVVNFE